MSDRNVRIHELLDTIRQGRILDAMKEFYAEDVVMEEPAYGRTEGLPANLAREQAFVDSVKELRGFETPKVVEEGNVSLYENVMDWIDVEGNPQRLEQIAVAEWRDGKIVHERFYYDRGQAA